MKVRGKARVAPLALISATMLLAGCATKEPVAAPIAQLPMLVPSRIPPMPLPPLGAATSMYIPQPGLDGLRPSPNRGLPEAEAIWNFRSAFNVAALNCQAADQLRMAGDYNSFIKVHAVPLRDANRVVDGGFIKRFPGANGLRVRDTMMTDIYNYFALPPTRQQFCELMLKRGQEVQTIAPSQLGAFARKTLDEIDDIFKGFYDAYDRYKRELAAWQALYGNRGVVIVENPSQQPQKAPPPPVFVAPGTNR